MSGINRFLSKREGKRNADKDGHQPPNHHHHHPSLLAKKATGPSPASGADSESKSADHNSAADFYGLFDATGGRPTPAEEQKIKVLNQRLLKAKGVKLREAQTLWALRSMTTNGDVDAAGGVLLAMSDASEGIVTSYSSTTTLLGAQNRHGVTCYLDATLFAMFSRLDSFEAMLYNSFDDVPRNKLAFVLRMWVNLLRSGRLITTDVTKVLQDTLAACGWREAAELHQQDASEAFTFITGKLDLPLMTLKMDIYHTGREDSDDDHKFINERLLEVAIPPDPTGERSEITLEECLEDYFNNRIEVRRYLERRATTASTRKTSAVHVETVEVDSDSAPVTPLSSSPIRPSSGRPVNRVRAPSIIQERYIPPRSDLSFSPLAAVNSQDSTGRSRTGSVRKEVMMPAWQFFSLIPWYTDHAPLNDAQVAAHFSSKRPILGLCLKRYAMQPSGRPERLNTQIDIPVEIGVPHFIQDEHMEDAGALHGNFKLSLQSVVCHRGTSVDSGHYIALVRGTPNPAASSAGDAQEVPRTWMRFDDLAPQRITVIDIEKALRVEAPYLLFYQIVPIDANPGGPSPADGGATTSSDPNASASEISSLSATADTHPRSGTPSFEIAIRDDGRGRSPTETRRTSVVSFSDLPPETPSDNAAPPSTADSGRGGNATLSPVSGKPGESVGRTLSKLTKRKSREVAVDDDRRAEVHVTEIGERSMSDVTIHKPGNLKPDLGKGQKREKSRSRLSRSKIRNEKPDRECVVM